MNPPFAQNEIPWNARKNRSKNDGSPVVRSPSVKLIKMSAKYVQLLVREMDRWMDGWADNWESLAAALESKSDSESESGSGPGLNFGWMSNNIGRKQEKAWPKDRGALSSRRS